ncbi:DUF1799 domain-containing protein [Pseudoalteromonas luteoviolacea]|uniref:DUF1799 domain-containing protein n=1 Tax=Pseudoalteromonas luteoviolacea TaxID=43657 RepID=UPI001B3A6B0B|nr:DUF1799 domain-containing protein [Pseudoalteromonas luteoviolacea]MBQ4909167.1 DUF1799 domain-containing protein [Pseudoalteromonas luteoviolacea]
MGDLATHSKHLDDDLAHFGAPIEPIKSKTDLYVLPQNWAAVKALSTANTQWQYCKDGIELALDYARAEIAWRYADITLTPTDFDKLQYLERTIIKLLRQTDEKPTEFGLTLTIRR